MTELTEEQWEWGYAFHVALRKCSDTQASSICWNAWHLLSAEDKAKFIENVWGVSPNEIYRKLIVKGDAVLYGKPTRTLFRIGLELMEPDELEYIFKTVEEQRWKPAKLESKDD